MAAEEKRKAEKMEAIFEKKFADNEFVMSGGIVMSMLNDRYEYVPSEGYPGCPSLVAMCKADLDKPNLDKKDRDTEFALITPEDDIGTSAKLFLRVELGNEMEAINALIFYLNERLGRETSAEEKARRHTQMLWRHRDVLLKDYKYQTRTNNKPYWTWEPRTVRGANIKYRPDIMQDDNMLRVRPRGPESVASSVASGMSRTLSHHLGSDEEAEKSPVDQPSTSGKQPSPSGTIETPGDPVETMEQGDEVEDSGETADPDATLTETQPGVQPEAEQDSERESDAPAEDEADESAEATEKRDDGKGAAARKKPTKVTVTDADVEAELEDVEISNPLGPALASLYSKLPDKVDDIPDPETQTEELKKMVLKLRPYQNSYQDEVNKKRLATIPASKPMSKNVGKREYNLLKKMVEERDKFENKRYEKRWNEAKKIALAKKRAALKEQEKEIKAREAFEKKEKLAAERRKAAEEKLLARQKEKAEAEKRAAAEAAAGPPESDPEMPEDSGAPPPTTSTAGDEDPENNEDESSSGSEVISSGPSQSRSRPAPAPVTLPITPRGKRPYLPDNELESRFGVILDKLTSLNTKVESIQKGSDKAGEKIFKVIERLAKAMDKIAEDTNELALQLLKQSFADHMKLIDQERRLLAFLPFDQVEPGMRRIMGNKFSAKVIAEHCWTGIKSSGYEDADLTTVTTTAAKVVFSADLRAFMKVVKGGVEVVPDANEEGAKGFDRVAVPTEYLDLFEKYILPRWGGRTTPVKSPKKSRRSWMDILGGHLKYQREQYFYWVAHGCKSLGEYLKKRHDIRKAMYLHNTPVDQRMNTVPSLRQEKLWYIEQTSCCSTEDELDALPVGRTRATYPSTRGDEIDMEEATDAVNSIVALQNNLPESAAALFDLTQGVIPSAGEVTKAIQDGLREKRSNYDFRSLGIEPAENLVENVTQEEGTTSRSASTSAERSRSRSRSKSADPGSAKKKRAPPKSPARQGSSPQKRPKAGGSKQAGPSTKKKRGDEE